MPRAVLFFGLVKPISLVAVRRGIGRGACLPPHHRTHLRSQCPREQRVGAVVHEIDSTTRTGKMRGWSALG